jgi:peptidoglycan/xylan/chitin deacetylase (PgdA/CDA1 family)
MRLRKVFAGFTVTVVTLAVIAVVVLHVNYVVPILMYHSITVKPAPSSMLAISVQTFERQMRFLKQHKYNVILLEDMIEQMRAGKRLPAKTVALTIDDGYKDNYTHAFAVLKKYNMPATIFLIINEIGRDDRLSWDEIYEMQQSGLIHFGSHTFGPTPLIDIGSVDEVRRQIAESKPYLEEKLHQPVKVFSYPEGRFTAAIRQMVIDAGYQGAVVTNPGKQFRSDDVYALKRLRISSNCGNLATFWLESSGYYNYIREHRHRKIKMCEVKE